MDEDDFPDPDIAEPAVGSAPERAADLDREIRRAHRAEKRGYRLQRSQANAETHVHALEQARRGVDDILTTAEEVDAAAKRNAQTALDLAEYGGRLIKLAGETAERIVHMAADTVRPAAPRKSGMEAFGDMVLGLVERAPALIGLVAAGNPAMSGLLENLAGVVPGGAPPPGPDPAPAPGAPGPAPAPAGAPTDYGDLTINEVKAKRQEAVAQGTPVPFPELGVIFDLVPEELGDISINEIKAKMLEVVAQKAA